MVVVSEEVGRWWMWAKLSRNASRPPPIKNSSWGAARVLDDALAKRKADDMMDEAMQKS